MKQFKDLGLSEGFVAVLERLKIIEPTEIQEKAIPYILKGKDVVGCAATGSGKTLAFTSGVIENMEPTGELKVLVLTPTRELAEQVASEFRKFAIKKFKVFSAYGGVKIDEHVKKIAGSDIVVATPGRLLDILDRQVINLKKIEVLILDEFDRMLDMGFSRDVDLIVRKCPEKRQTILFSATKTEEIEKIVEEYTNKPKEIIVKSHIDSSKLEQVYYKVLPKDKFSLFYSLLKSETYEKVLVFCSTRLSTESLATSLDRLGLQTKIIHGGLDQKERTRTLKSFHKDGGILVCTDVASRGLDIKEISHVYNYHLPKRPEDYIHRIGRTARAGKNGKAVTILTDRDEEMFEQILELPNMRIQEMDLPIFERIEGGNLLKLKKQINEKTHTKKRGMQWISIDDPALSKRFKKRTVARDLDEESPRVSSKKTRRAGSKAKKQKRGQSNKKTSARPKKDLKVTRGRAGNRTGTRKVKKRAKGRANRKTRK